jgi:hypothetical protein
LRGFIFMFIYSIGYPAASQGGEPGRAKKSQNFDT